MSIFQTVQGIFCPEISWGVYVIFKKYNQMKMIHYSIFTSIRISAIKQILLVINFDSKEVLLFKASNFDLSTIQNTWEINTPWKALSKEKIVSTKMQIATVKKTTLFRCEPGNCIENLILK